MFIADSSACQTPAGIPANASLPASLLRSIPGSVPQSAPSRDLASMISQAFDNAIAAYNEGRVNDPEAYASLGPNIVRDVANTNARGAGGPASPVNTDAGASGSGTSGEAASNAFGGASGGAVGAVCVISPGDPVEVSPLHGTAPNRARTPLRTEQGLDPPATPPRGLAGFGGALTINPYAVSCGEVQADQKGGISPWWWVLAIAIAAVALSDGKGRR